MASFSSVQQCKYKNYYADVQTIPKEDTNDDQTH